ncbi:tetratricopeptide repeat protein [Streptosporangium sp. NPDC051022]|uniref:tetratricopeptide repeat protein n=1 Tax=Streptosporangium sp. NPDC051022 TaxID=3155752 RepID=UPI00343F7BE3
MTDPPTGNVEAQAQGNSRQFNLGQGTMNVHLAAERPTTALFTVIPPPDLVGRDQEINALLAGVRGAREAGCPLVVTALQGMAGVGKTALARAVAARLTGEFPDARLEVDLYGFTPGEEPRDPADVLAELLSLAGFQAADLPVSLPGKSQLWRSWLAGRDVLLVLDNARDAAQVRPLLPGAASQCLVLITSRNELDDLDSATRVRLDTLPVADALTLLDRLSGRTVSADDELRGELARLCGYLPLALRPVGALLAEVSDAEVIEAMRSAARPLLHVPTGERAVAAAFNVSYFAANTAEQAMLRACAWHPGPDFDAYSLAALTECAPAVAALALAGLAKRSMLLRLPGRRYAFHDLFLGYTQERASHDDSDVTVADGHERLCAYLFTTVDLATDELLGRAETRGDSYPGPALGSPKQAHDWLTAATAELRNVAHFALASNLPSAVRLSRIVAWWLLMDNRPDQAYALRTETADHCHRGGDRLGQADAMIGLGDVAATRGEYGEASEAYRQARALYEEIGDRLGQAHAMRGLGGVAATWGEYGEASEAYRQARALYEEIGDRLGQADAMIGLGGVARIRGEAAEAAEAYRQARALYEEIGDRLGQAHAMIGLGDVAATWGEYGEAAEAYRQARALYEEIGDRLGQAHAMRGLGGVARIRGEYGEAAEAYRQARALYEEIGDRFGQAHAMIGLGDVARMRGEYGEAAEAYRQARALCEEIGDRLGQANISLSEARMAESRGDSALACVAFARAGRIYGMIGLVYWENHCDQERSRLGCS